MLRHSLTEHLLWRPPLFTIQRFGRLLKRRPVRGQLRRVYTSGNALVQLQPCFFVLSTGRTGTQTLAALLNLSPEVIVYHEPPPTLWSLAKLAYENKNTDVQLLSSVLLETRAPLLDHSLACGLGYGETGNFASFLAYVISKAIPQARFVHLVRDPRMVVRSYMRRRPDNGSDYASYRPTPRPDNAWAEAWNSWGRFEKLAWLWAETNRYILEFTNTAGSGKTVLLKAEDMFAGESCALLRVFDFLGLTPPSKRAINRVLTRHLNRQRKSSFSEPGRWSYSMHSILIEIASSEMRRLGYEVEKEKHNEYSRP